ncbi:MAG: hypothetical protein WDM89_11940 [Rhizomicrobium sp.]
MDKASGSASAGDPVKGTRFADLLPVFADDPGTDAIVVVGEIGGNEEKNWRGGSSIQVSPNRCSRCWQVATRAKA